MKKAFSLIELIITIVIMAGVFMVIPKIVFSSSKSDTIALKQEAILEGFSITNIASLLAWDENNTQKLDILQTQSSAFECNSSVRFRLGSYLGSNGRMCENDIYATLPLGTEDGEEEPSWYDDIDDFANTELNITTPSGKLRYKIYTQVTYLSDDYFSQNGSDLYIDLNQSSPTNSSTNIKYLKTVIAYKGRSNQEKNITHFNYFSTNIGQFSLNSRSW